MVRVNPEDLITQTTAAQIRGVSLQAIMNLVKRGSLKSIMIDGHTFVWRSEVKKFKPSLGGRPKGSKKKKKS
jgi:hypothetical protein